MSLAACLMKARVEEALIKMHLPGVPICAGIELEDDGLCGPSRCNRRRGRHGHAREHYGVDDMTFSVCASLRRIHEQNHF